jgi:acyl-CoA reductase-like NAD-dependent aldehyde dehydrogenase
MVPIGSVPTGVKVMQAAAPQVKRLTYYLCTLLLFRKANKLMDAMMNRLELGGKSSAIVMEDVSDRMHTDIDDHY